ncbi:hypothetical protein THAOC_01036 [Thalassiosira oceanica]|uniref:Uncharacterized protein n=1 Tax=Thalassiosira oceanica TaxID=159749 RepID=K0TNI2_THAOC|nr:hypothetical protein THAOC_01036 [Thalassiosira oceanica]|eukprot:EJK77151.1 hypothetical protein THAOC_01036 [Thalassiosira oceanica]
MHVIITAMTANVQDVVNDLHNMISNMPMNYTPRKAARHDSMIDVHSPASVGGPPQVDAASAVAARASAQPDGAARASTQPDGAARASTQSDGVSERTAPSALAAARPVSAAMTSSNGVATNAFEEMARDLLLDLERVAVEEDRANRQYFDYNKNHLSPEDENEYIIAVGDKAKAWTQIVIRQCFSVQEEIANNIPDDGERKRDWRKLRDLK